MVQFTARNEVVMKLRLVVQTEGVNKGKAVDISGLRFLIGRDHGCDLRPSSPLISKRHCALIKRDAKAYLQDFDSTNGTLLNDRSVKGEIEIKDGDVVKIGPLTFVVKIDATVPVDKPTPVPASKVPVPEVAAVAVGADAPAPKSKKLSGAASDDEIAALLLDDDTATGGPLAADRVPDGSTIMDLAAIPGKELDKEAQAKADAEKKRQAMDGDTRSAAESILKKYMKRPRK
jgi:pSer/pThr/pTyr-binding forkhead associated (FHA) protein